MDSSGTIYQHSLVQCSDDGLFGGLFVWFVSVHATDILVFFFHGVHWGCGGMSCNCISMITPPPNMRCTWGDTNLPTHDFQALRGMQWLGVHILSYTMAWNLDPYTNKNIKTSDNVMKLVAGKNLSTMSLSLYSWEVHIIVGSVVVEGESCQFSTVVDVKLGDKFHLVYFQCDMSPKI